MPQLSVANYALSRLKYQTGLDASGNVRHSYAPRVYNVMDYGATGDGATNDTAAFAAAVAAIPAAGGALYVPAGTYMVDSATIVFGAKPVAIIGDGMDVSVIKKRSAGVLVNCSGSNSATRNFYSSIADLTLHGNSLTGALMKVWHVSCLHANDMHLMNCPDVAIDFVEAWDSRFYNLHLIDCSGADGTKPAVWIRNTANNSGAGVLGYSTDNSNNLFFNGCHWETFKDGAVWLAQGDAANTANPNLIFLDECKLETIYARGPFVKINQYAIRCKIDKCLLSAVGKDTGVAANSISMVEWFGSHGNKITNTECQSFTDAFNRIIECWTNEENEIDVLFEGTSNPGTGVVVSVTGGSTSTRINARTVLGTVTAPTTATRKPIQALSNASQTLYGWTFEHVHTMTPSVQRTITLAGYPYSASWSANKMQAGDRKRIINLSAANTIVVKNLTSGGTTIRTIDVSSWSDFEFDGTDWVLIGNGTYDV